MNIKNASIKLNQKKLKVTNKKVTVNKLKWDILSLLSKNCWDKSLYN